MQYNSYKDSYKAPDIPTLEELKDPNYIPPSKRFSEPVREVREVTGDTIITYHERKSKVSANPTGQGVKMQVWLDPVMHTRMQKVLVERGYGMTMSGVVRALINQWLSGQISLR